MVYICIFHYSDVIDGKFDVASDDVIDKHLTWAVKERISVLDDLLAQNYAFLWSLPSEDNFRNLSAICDHMTVSEIVTETVSMVKGIPEEGFTEEKLTDKLRTFAKENNLKFPKLMKLMRTVISGLKVSKVKLALVCYRYLTFLADLKEISLWDWY